MTRKPIDAMAIGLMVVLCLTWGFQQVAVKVVASDMSPVLQMALRSGIALLLLSTLILWRGGRLVRKATLLPGLLAGFLFAIEFLFLAEVLRFTSASRLVVFLYTTPIFVALGLHWTQASERLNKIQWFGISAAFVGIAAAFLGSDDSSANELPKQLLGDGLAILAALAWAATTVLIRNSSLSNTPATQTLWYQLLMCCLLLLAYALVTDQLAVVLSPLVWVNLAFQAIVVSFGTLLIWFWLLTQYPAAQLSVFTFLTPLFGVALGVLILNEALPNSFIIGAALVMLGIVLVNGHAKINQLLPVKKERNYEH